MKELEWSSLMRAALAGDNTAYHTLLTAIAPHIRGVVRRLLSHSNQADVEDVVQDTLLAVHLKRMTWDQTLAFLPWLNAVARYKAIDALRRKGSRLTVDIDFFADELSAPERAEGTSLDIETVLSRLGKRDRTIVEQVYLEGQSSQQVGARLGMTDAAVRVALHRAIKLLSSTFNGQKT